jgi:hypothetical protein
MPGFKWVRTDSDVPANQSRNRPRLSGCLFAPRVTGQALAASTPGTKTRRKQDLTRTLTLDASSRAAIVVLRLFVTLF